MDLGLTGKAALVWGGSKGMGYAAARQLALEGVDVVIAARTESSLQAAAQALSAECGRPVRYVVADITRKAGREAALAAWGGILAGAGVVGWGAWRAWAARS